MGSIKSLVYILKEIQDLGLRGSVFRIKYEFMNRSGARRLLQPVRPCWQVKSKYYLGVSSISLDLFRSRRQNFFISEIDKLAFGLKRFYKESDKNIMQDALMAKQGKIKCFGSWYADYGYPVNWHFNPFKKTCWPYNEHWSCVLKKEVECGDCKLTWEINRFPHVYSWLRAYVLTRDSQWVSAFNEQVIEWENFNPYRSGLNWNSGQELAIRSLTWIAALYVFMDDPAFKEEDFHRLLRLLFLHGEHIEANINYARLAVHNNHLISEALALYLIGSYFPWMSGSKRWKRKGRALLESDCLKQFYNDGGYCQCSHNYHRLALHYYIWACRAGECLGEPFGPEVYRILFMSGNYLWSFINEKDGRLPNWGANDGALLCPWTSCDYSDFRPLINTIRYITRHKRAFASGPWDEELLWFLGPDALEAEVLPYKHSDIKIFPESGLQVLRQGPDDFAVMRCGSVIDRFGQADQLHVDIWWKGLNVAQDGGSYLYNDELRYHHCFMTTGSHNTVTVDGKDQMLLYRRFKWLNRVKALQKGVVISGGVSGVAGEHYGYCRLPGKVMHRRYLFSLENSIYVVADSVFQESNCYKHLLKLHWLLGPWDSELGHKNNWLIVSQYTSQGVYNLYLNVFNKKYCDAVKPDFSFARGENGLNPRGWFSRYYGVREPAVSVEVSYITADPVLFISIFAPWGIDWEAWYENDQIKIRTVAKKYCLQIDT